MYYCTISALCWGACVSVCLFRCVCMLIVSRLSEYSGFVVYACVLSCLYCINKAVA